MTCLACGTEICCCDSLARYSGPPLRPESDGDDDGLHRPEARCDVCGELCCDVVQYDGQRRCIVCESQSHVRTEHDRDRLARLHGKAVRVIRDMVADTKAHVRAGTWMAGEAQRLQFEVERLTRERDAARAEADRVRTVAVRDLHREYLTRTPEGTRLCYYRPAHRDCPGEVIVLGYPAEGSNHNCDAMGCGSMDHVVERVRVATAPGPGAGERSDR